MIHFLTAFAPMLLGMWIHLLLQVRDYKKVAKLNPNPNIEYSFKAFIDSEWLNYVIFISCGAAFIAYFPGFLTGTSVVINGENGTPILKVDADVFKAPMFFLIGLSGSDALLSIFGNYKKTLFKQTLPDSNG